METQEAKDAAQGQPLAEKVKRKRKRHRKRKKAPGPTIPLLDEMPIPIAPIQEVAATSPTEEAVDTLMSTPTEVELEQIVPTPSEVSETMQPDISSQPEAEGITQVS